MRRIPWMEHLDTDEVLENIERKRTHTYQKGIVTISRMHSEKRRLGKLDTYRTD